MSSRSSQTSPGHDSAVALVAEAAQQHAQVREWICELKSREQLLKLLLNISERPQQANELMASVKASVTSTELAEKRAEYDDLCEALLLLARDAMRAEPGEDQLEWELKNKQENVRKLESELALLGDDPGESLKKAKQAYESAKLRKRVRQQHLDTLKARQHYLEALNLNKTTQTPSVSATGPSSRPEKRPQSLLAQKRERALDRQRIETYTGLLSMLNS